MRRTPLALALTAASFMAAVLPVALASPASALVDPGTGYNYEITPTTVPIVYPVLGRTSVSDNFLACRSGCSRMHMGQDVMGAKMLPVVAAFNGTVTQIKREAPGSGGGNYLVLTADERDRAHGWTAHYVHVNNDTPGTDDGLGTADWAFPRGIEVGTKVLAGQLIAWNGDSGNAETTGPHIHFELRKTTPDGRSGWAGTVYNAFPSLQAARRLTVPRPSGPHPDGSLIRRPDGALFVLEAGTKRLVTSTMLPAVNRSAADAVPVTNAEAVYYPTALPVGPRDGAVVRDPRGTTWLVAGGTRARAPMADLAALGLAAPRIFKVTDADLASDVLRGQLDTGRL